MLCSCALFSLSFLGLIPFALSKRSPVAPLQVYCCTGSNTQLIYTAEQHQNVHSWVSNCARPDKWTLEGLIIS
jgi:hypothetical protein